jgi:glyoxylase-like metal-dependent hydrolase (beta-lactamase superfamily II)
VQQEILMTLTITRIPAGPIETNAYLVVENASKAALIIDAPPESLSLIQAAVAEQGAKVQSLIITHGHWDHIGDTDAIAKAFEVPVITHTGVVDRIMTPESGKPVPIPPATVDSTIDDGDTVALGEHVFTVMHLPGHDEGHIVLVSEADDVFLGGDVLFPNGHGRTDIPGSDQATMEKSIARLLDLPDSLVVYSGHGSETTIGAERPWMTRMAQG